MAKLDDAAAARGAFDPVVGTVVVVLTVAVVFAVVEIMFALVADQIVQRVPVVRCYEIDAVVWPAAAGLVQVARTSQPGGHRTGHAEVVTPIAADIVAVAPVPFRPPLIGERANLVGSGRVPRLGNDLGI